MRLYEFEAKKLLEENDFNVPQKGGDKLVVKAQVLTNNRKKYGGIRFAGSQNEAEKISDEMKQETIEGHDVKKVLVENKVDYSKEYYISFIYDTETRKPTLLYSDQGGSGVEERNISKLPLKEENSKRKIKEFLKDKEIGQDATQEINKLFQIFLQEDMRLLEINPLVKAEDKFVVLDAMIELEDDASYRHSWDYEERSLMSREKTEREKTAEKIDENDHRGVAGKYTELEGNIGMMLAGGGASLTNMDALINYGGEPANYTEYGGNPPTEKVYKLSKVIMSKPGLKGLWHVGGTANNTDIYKTMKGFCQALREIKPDYPILIRRDGPNADKAFDLLEDTKEELDLEMKLYRNDKPMTKTAEKLIEMIEK